MRKILNSAEEHAILSVKNTRSRSILMSNEDMAVLGYPELFQHVNRPRLFKELTDNAITALNDLDYLFAWLPDSYKARVISSRQLQSFVKSTLETAKMVDDKNAKPHLRHKSIDEKTRHTSSYYMTVSSTLFNLALESFIESAPKEFQPMLSNGIQPFVKLMNAIAEFAKSQKLNIQVPAIEIGKHIK